MCYVFEYGWNITSFSLVSENPVNEIRVFPIDLGGGAGGVHSGRPDRFAETPRTFAGVQKWTHINTKQCMGNTVGIYGGYKWSWSLKLKLGVPASISLFWPPTNLEPMKSTIGCWGLSVDLHILHNNTAFYLTVAKSQACTCLHHASCVSRWRILVSRTLL